MSFSAWKTATIASSGAVSTAVDLEHSYGSLAVFVPAIDSGTLSIQTAMTSDGTYQNLYLISTSDADDDQVLCSTSTGAINVVVPFFGFQHLKFTTGATGTAARTIYCRGFN